LVQKVEDAHSAVEAAHAEMLAAQERFNTAFAKEARLRKQMELNERRADEAIAVEERSILDLEAEEQAELDLPSFDPLPWDDRLLLSPGAWESFLLPPPAGEASADVGEIVAGGSGSG
jgi:hypothetical protein